MTNPEPSNSERIFISYRRNDSGWATQTLFQRLTQIFGEESLFHDSHVLKAGDNFSDRIREALKSCHVMIVVIGEDWLGDTEGGKSRILEEGDWVRLEVEAALERGMRIIPVLVDPAKFPESGDLPRSLSDLRTYEFVKIFAGADFEIGFGKLVLGITEGLTGESRKRAEQNLFTNASEAQVSGSPLTNLVGILIYSTVLITATALLAIFLYPARDGARNEGLDPGVVDMSGYLSGDSGLPNLVRFYPKSNDFLPNLTHMFALADEDIWLLGVNFHISASNRKEEFLDAMERGVDLRFLILDPKAPAEIFESLVDDFDQSAESIQLECELGFSGLKDLQNEWHKRAEVSLSLGRMEVRTYQTVPWTRIYCVDPEKEEGTAFLVPYMNGVNSVDLPGLYLEGASGEITKSYFSAFKKMWKISKAVDW